jgi:hypothetical protein
MVNQERIKKMDKDAFLNLNHEANNLPQALGIDLDRTMEIQLSLLEILEEESKTKQKLSTSELLEKVYRLTSTAEEFAYLVFRCGEARGFEQASKGLKANEEDDVLTKEEKDKIQEIVNRAKNSH